MSRFFRHLLIALACSLASGCFWETTDASYPTAQEVIDRGFLDKGWIPHWLPPDATDLRETHNIDTNVSELSFSIPARDSLDLPDNCTSVAFQDIVPAYIQRRWWPSEQDLRNSYDFFKCPADVTQYTFVGVGKSGQRVIHWRTYAR